MRIGIDARFWNETGVGRYIRNLVEQLQLLDDTNEYVLFVRSEDYEKLKLKTSKFKVVRADIRWHSVEEQIKFPQLLYKENLDLMHFPYFSVPIFYHKPFVITIHDLIINHFPTGKATTLPLPFYKLKYVGYQFVLQQAAKRAAKIITVSHATKREIVEHLGVPEKKIVVTYEGVDQKLSSKFKVQSSEFTSPYFLYVGNAYPHKNLERLVLAIKEVAIKEKNMKFVFVGKDDFFYKRLKEKVKFLDLNNTVIFLQHVSDEELGSLYQHAEAVVLPSLMEGFGLPAVEAMAAKCLVLVSDIPAFREICKDGAIYFNPQDSHTIAVQMERILHDRQAFKATIDHGEMLAKKFSWKTMAEQTLAVYNSGR